MLNEIDEIKALLRASPNGMGIREIEGKLSFKMARHTLQRRLQKLTALNEIRVEGEKRSARYFIIDTYQASRGKINLSAEAKKILALVSSPLSARKHVKYHSNFLMDYVPNKSFYLSESERGKLAEMGHTSQATRPAGTYAKKVLNRLLIDLSWNSSRMEGNTYSLLDTERLIARGETPQGKSASETQMILNHKDAISFLVEFAEEVSFNRYTILNLHALLANNLLPDPAARGRLRSMAVGIGQSTFEPLAIPQQIELYFDLILEKLNRIKNPFEQSFFAMVHLPYLQPFDDVNKRVSRLAANIPLFRENLAPLSFVDMPNDLYIHGMLGIYELNRIKLFKEIFLWAYERSCVRYASIRQVLGEPDPFRVKYRDEMRQLITRIIEEALTPEQTSLVLKSYVEKLPAEDRSSFIELIESELLSLHEGNVAWYRIRPSQFTAWQKVWHLYP